MSKVKPTILVVDDEEDVQALLTKCFNHQGWNVIVASDGNDCIEKARAEKPDVIVLDIIMPKLDGYHACHWLKNDPELKNIPIIMLTAKTEPFQQEKGEMVGADAYFCKPCDLNELTNTVKSYLS
ncbi:MAG: response regulator transcription factor [Planctomycetota bacterium]|jgi:DNA-binding response OmpR family regulator